MYISQTSFTPYPLYETGPLTPVSKVYEICLKIKELLGRVCMRILHNLKSLHERCCEYLHTSPEMRELHKAKELYRKQDFDNSLNHLNKSMSLSSAHSICAKEIHYYFAKIHRRKNNLIAAKTSLENALKVCNIGSEQHKIISKKIQKIDFLVSTPLSGIHLDGRSVPILSRCFCEPSYSTEQKMKVIHKFQRLQQHPYLKGILNVAHVRMRRYPNRFNLILMNRDRMDSYGAKEFNGFYNTSNSIATVWDWRRPNRQNEGVIIHELFHLAMKECFHKNCSNHANGTTSEPYSCTDQIQKHRCQIAEIKTLELIYKNLFRLLRGCESSLQLSSRDQALKEIFKILPDVGRHSLCTRDEAVLLSCILSGYDRTSYSESEYHSELLARVAELYVLSKNRDLIIKWFEPILNYYETQLVPLMQNYVG